MACKVLIAHARGEEDQAEKLAAPLRQAGYEVAHLGTVLVGESVIEEASKVLSLGGPVVLCGTVKALGTRWARQVVNAARSNKGSRVYAVQMEEEADVGAVAFDDQIASYWQDPGRAIRDLIAALQKYYPQGNGISVAPGVHAAEHRYRELALESCDIIDLANLPETDRHIATRHLELRRLYVPLRVRTEIRSTEQVTPADLQSIERRRHPKGHSAFRTRPGFGRQPVGRQLGKAGRLVVLGDPGAGKSTLVRWIATAYLLRLKHDPGWKGLPDVETLPDEDWLPVMVRCRDLDKPCTSGSLDDVLRHTFRKSELTDAEGETLVDILREKLAAGRALLLLDGLDEITDPAERIGFCRQIEQIQIAFPAAAIIATSRIVGYREMGYRIGRGFEHVTVSDLRRKEKDDFARRWCGLTELPERRDTAAAELIKDIHSTDRIERLTGNPMLLTTLALVKRKVGKLPSRRADLYWEAVQVLLNWRSEVDQPIDSREAVPQLEYLAYSMCERGIQQISEDETVELFDRMRQEYPALYAIQAHPSHEFLRALERRTGILVEAGHERYCGRSVPVFEFRHLTFQEYLAALALVEGRYPGRDRSRTLAQQVAPLAGRTERGPNREMSVAENWSEALRLCVAVCSDDVVDDVLLAVLKPLMDEDSDVTRRPRAVLAALCLADEPNVNEDTARAVLQAFVRGLDRRDGSVVLSSAADRAALELAPSRWAELLRSLLIDEFLRRDPTTSRRMVGVVCAAVLASGAPRDPSEIEGWLAGRVAQFAPNGEKTGIARALCIVGLGRQKASAPVWPQIIADLVGMLVNGTPEFVAAAWALSVMGKADELVAVNRLVSRLDDADVDVRLTATQALGEIRDSRAVEPLLVRLDESSVEVRMAAVSALEQFKTPQSVTGMLARLDHQYDDVRRGALRLLAKMKDTRAIELFIARLDHANDDVRREAASLLAEIPDSRSVEPLIGRLSDQNMKVRHAAARALGEIKDPRAVEPLIPLLQVGSTKVRRNAARALGKIKDVRAVIPLTRLLMQGSNTRIMRAAATALGEIKDVSAVEPLITLLHHGSQTVRTVAAWALGEIGDARAAEHLRARLDDPSNHVKKAVKDALGKILQVAATRKGAVSVIPLPAG